MHQNDKPSYDERISLYDLIIRFKKYFLYLLSKWLVIGISTIILATVYISQQYLKKIVFTSETTFVLETPGSSGGGQLSSLASLAGINLGSIGGNSSLFQIDNITELYKSRTILKEVFLTKQWFEGEEQRLITRYGSQKKLISQWQKWAENAEFTFEVPDQDLTVMHDSILFEVIKKFKEKQLGVSKPDRKLDILSIIVNDTDEIFAKRFNEVLVEKVNAFYLETKTKKSAINLKILQKQADSTKAVLDVSLSKLAEATETIPNPNPIFYTTQVPIQKLQIDVQSTALVYQEIVKNLEVAKVTLRNNTPLIQIIDRPQFPLPSTRPKLVKTVVLGIFFGGLLSVIYFTLAYIVRAIIDEEKGKSE